MTRLSRIIAPALIATAALSAAMPAQAAPYQERHHAGHYDGRNDGRHDASARTNAIRQQITQLERRIERNDNRDRISEREATRLRRDVRDLRQQFRTFSRNGLTQSEFRTLERRIDQLRARLQMERHDRDGRRW